MTKKIPSRILVVDASVARSAGETQHPISSACRKALMDMLGICHRLAWTQEISAEWRKHASRFSQKWRGSMVARKKLVNLSPSSLLIPDLSKLGLSASQQAAVEKDLSLVECACDADGIIVTRDKEIRSLWERCQAEFRTPKPLRWVNPESEEISSLDSVS